MALSPHSFPPWETVYGYFAKWQKDGVFAQLNGLLRELVRRKEGRNASPSACVIDAQSVKTSTSAPHRKPGHGRCQEDRGPHAQHHHRPLGLLLAVLATAAGIPDSTAGRTLLEQAAADHPSLRKVWVDGGHRKHFVEHAATLGIDLEIIRHTPGRRGFTPIPKHWTVERTYGWLIRGRSLLGPGRCTAWLASHSLACMSSAGPARPRSSDRLQEHAPPRAD